MARAVACVIGLAMAWTTAAQGLAGDLLAGKLINPRVGQWAWYDLHDTQNDARFAVREAIVGKERVDGETGYWLEIEIIPQAGYKTVMKTLLTGPASDPDNIHRLILKRGFDPIQDVPVHHGKDPMNIEGRVKRKSLGMEEIPTANGTIRAEKFQVTADGKTNFVWTNPDVLPTGVVRMQSPHGLWVLRNYGEGGEHAETILPHEEMLTSRAQANEALSGEDQAASEETRNDDAQDNDTENKRRIGSGFRIMTESGEVSEDE